MTAPTPATPGRWKSSYEPRHTPPSGDDYGLIKRASKRFLHYYCYVLDPIMGP